MTDTTQVEGDPDRLRTQARRWGHEAAAYDRQVNRLTSIRDSLPATSFRGAKGDAMRLFLSDTLRTATAMRAAYQQIGNAAPSVADAIQQAKEAARRRDTAQRELERAARELTRCELEVAQAAAALAAAVVRDVLGSGHATARAEEVLRAAERRRDRAKGEQDEAERAYTRANTAFTEAQETRQRRSEAFAHLLRSQETIVRQAAASPPPVPGVAPVSSAVHDLTVLGYGRQAIKAALDVQLLVARSTADVGKVLSLSDQARLLLRKGVSLSDVRTLRALDSGGGFGPLTPKQATALSTIEKWGGRLTKANYALSGALSIGTNVAKVANDPTLSRQEKQDLVVNRVLGEFGGGVAGGLACSPGLVAGTACGYAGSKAGGALAATPAGRFVTDKVSRLAVTPILEPAYDLADGASAPEVVKDVLTVRQKIMANVGRDLSPVTVKFDGGLPSVGLKVPIFGK
ncbi:WXG100 family type VII secretion target [Jatrophihabitans fulvus]